jgi:uncharacterized protein
MQAAPLNPAQRFLMALLRAYRFALSPWLGSACRFEPTCSAYSLQAIEAHGAAAGTYMTLHRLARCHPWCAGGHDSVPERPPALFNLFCSGAPVRTGAAPSPSTDKTPP